MSYETRINLIFTAVIGTVIAITAGIILLLVMNSNNVADVELRDDIVSSQIPTIDARDFKLYQQLAPAKVPSNVGRPA